MRFPFLPRRPQIVREPRTAVAIAFTMEDFAEMQGYAAGLAPYGISWRVDAMDIVLPEVAIISRNGMPIFQLWRSTAGLLLRCLDTERDAGTIELPDQNRAWSLVCCLTRPPIWLDTAQDASTGNRVMACLLKWLRA
jgi:hypothetical protein